jgi:4-amino-4-deoxy-L-arabinose transferase-like glycosyltransferase
MIYASIIVEALRVRPALVFWLAALAQALTWVLVPALFYSAPPGNLAEALAIGREFRLGTVYGPPLAYWLADIAYSLAGGRLVGLYLLAQLCVLVTLWSLMALGASIVGLRHSVLAILLMVGVSAIVVPTPDFGPHVLAMPLWSLALLHTWRVFGERRRRYWLPLAIELGLLLLTAWLAIALVVLLDLFLIATRRGREMLRTLDPWLCVAIVAIVVLPYALWLAQQPELLAPVRAGWRPLAPMRDAMTWLRLLGDLTLAHAGAVLLVALASGWPFKRRQRVPSLARDATPAEGRAFVLFFTLAPPLAASLLAVLYAPSPPLVAAAPVVVLSGLAVIVVAGETIRLHRQRVLAYAWLGLLIAAPVMVALGVTLLPRLLPIELRVAQPAAAVAGFFAETFERRTGQPLAIVAGDRRLAALVAAASRSRPRQFIDATTTPWLTADDIRTRGAVVLWPAADTPGTPPPEIKARFPDLVLEIPRLFERPLQGFGPPLRIGWAVIRPGIRDQGSGIRR